MARSDAAGGSEWVDLWPLYTDDPLVGPHPVRRLLRPPVDAELVAADDWPAACDAVERACGTWGGAYRLLLPARRGSDILPRWQDVLRGALVEHTAGNGLVPEPEDPHHHPAGGGLWMPDGIRSELLLSVLARAPEADKGWRPVDVAQGLDADDPWSLAYLAVLGRLPEAVAPMELQMRSLRPGLGYSDVLTLRPVDSPPGAQDLLDRLRAEDGITAASLSCALLSRFPAPVGSQFDAAPLVPRRWQEAADLGPNLVVVYEPGSVEDLALLWYLRALHGLPHGFPLGVPVTADVPAALDTWTGQRAATVWGLRTTACALVSASVPDSDLRALGSQTRLFGVVSPEQVLQPAAGCGIPSSEVAMFSDGAASVASYGPADAAALGREVIEEHGGWMRLRVTVPGRRLPDSATMRRDRFGAVFHHGAEVGVSPRRETTEIVYPTGLDVLHAVLQDHGLRGRPSAPGLAAEHFARQLGGLDGLDNLMSPMALEALRRLTARKGMSTLHRRLNAFLAPDGLTDSASSPQDADVRARLLEQRLDEALGAPGPEDVGAVAPSALRTVFGDTGAANGWLRWAVDRRLVLRGVTARCAACGLRQWRQLPEFLPVLVCHGCGTDVEEPFGLDAAHFTYRASEALLRALDTDVLPHLLALRFFCRLLGGSVGEDGLVHGGYPGVELMRPVSDAVLAEVDVVLVLADGRLVLGECKTSARGLDQAGLQRLWSLADEVGAAMTFVATLDPAAACGDAWRETGGRAHVALTAEHLFHLHPVAVLGGEPLAWRDQYVTGISTPATEDEFRQVVTRSLREPSAVRWWRTMPWRFDS